MDLLNDDRGVDIVVPQINCLSVGDQSKKGYSGTKEFSTFSWNQNNFVNQSSIINISKDIVVSPASNSARSLLNQQKEGNVSDEVNFFRKANE